MRAVVTHTCLALVATFGLFYSSPHSKRGLFVDETGGGNLEMREAWRWSRGLDVDNSIRRRHATERGGGYHKNEINVRSFS